MNLPPALLVRFGLDETHNGRAQHKRAEFEIAAMLGMTRQELRNRMSQSEFLDWLAFLNVKKAHG